MVLNVNILPIEELESRIEEEVKSYIYGFKTPGIQIIIYIYSVAVDMNVIILVKISSQD